MASGKENLGKISWHGIKGKKKKLRKKEKKHPITEIKLKSDGNTRGPFAPCVGRVLFGTSKTLYSSQL